MNAYQQAVEWLTANPICIRVAWANPYRARGGCLFDPCSHSKMYPRKEEHDLQKSLGCLTQIRTESEIYVCEIPELTAMISEDNRLPASSANIQAEHLPFLAQWQQFLDFLLDRDPPPLDDRLPPPVGNIEIPPISELEDQYDVEREVRKLLKSPTWE
jgi:hypothetical protein